MTESFGSGPRQGQSLRGRPVHEICMPVNEGNCPLCDEGEAAAWPPPYPLRCSNSNKTFEQPPRPLLVDASRLLLMSRPPLLSKRGNGAHPNSFTPSMTAHD